MFCRQCEQTAKGTGCTVKGVCGKTAETAALQDLLIQALKGIAVYGKETRVSGKGDRAADLFIIEGLFTTVTNVNFDPERIAGMIRRACGLREKAKSVLEKLDKRKADDIAEKFRRILEWEPADSQEGLIGQSRKMGLMPEAELGGDSRSLREILLYGLKGMAAYADHARILGQEDEGVNAFFYKGLSAIADTALTADDLTELVMEFGKVNLKCMEILDRAHTAAFGDPAPSKVRLGVKKGPAIIVSGHDLHDLKQLLEQTAGAGVNIYTHGEMLPAHGYPELRRHKHLAGHFGTAWQNQQKEFDGVPAAILMTTNCIQLPRPSYSDRIFTTGLVAWPGVGHLDAENGRKDFSSVIEKARKLKGFAEDRMDKEILTGFGHNAVLSIAGKIIEAVKTKAVRHFFLIGGCDGTRPGRNYFTELAQKVPKDAVILTLGCGKFRFNRLDFGDIGGIPRLLDCGQCNDAYSAIKIASALADAFKCGVNDLPLSMILSWYEQKAVCVLLTLLSLGIKNIRLGPTLPAFISPNVLKSLVEKFGIKPVTDPQSDLDEMLGQRCEMLEKR